MSSRVRLERWLLVVVTLALLLVPLVVWRSATLVGGDDSGLYYLYPHQYFRAYTTQIIEDNYLGSIGSYYPQLYIAPFALLLSGVHSLLPFVDLQKLFFGFNLAGGFFFFYLLLGLFLPSLSRREVAAKATASLLYVLSQTTIYTLWQNRLFSLYLVAIFPLVLYFFLRGVLRRQPASVVIAALLLSLWSVVLLSVPWFFALILVLLPILALVAAKQPGWFFRMAGLFVLLLILFNFYWLAHLIYSPFSSTGPATDMLSTLGSTSFRQMNATGIREVSDHNQLLYPLFGLFHKNLQLDFVWKTYPLYRGWQLYLLPLFSVFLALILVTAAKVKRGWQYSGLFLAAAVSWCLALYLFTVKIGEWGQPLFLLLNASVPGFTMFRNMYDKFGLALGFSFAFLLAVALARGAELLRRPGQRTTLFAVAFGIILLTSLPFLAGRYTENQIWQTEHTYGQIGQLNGDFLDLVDYLKQQGGPGRALWLPLNYANYVQIQDSHEVDHYYSGVSPLGFLAGKADLVGLLSFPQADGDRLLGYLLNRQYTEVGRIFETFNVRYIIVNRNLSSDLERSYLFDSRLWAAQDDEFQRALLGRHVRDFGQRYSLYEIAPAFQSDKIFLSGSKDSFQTTGAVQAEKIRGGHYRITVSDLKEPATLVFLEPYHAQWQLREVKSGQIIAGEGRVVAVNGTNGWQLDPAQLAEALHVSADNGVSFEADLVFGPTRLTPLFLMISGGAVTLAVLYLIFRLVQPRFVRRP